MISRYTQPIQAQYLPMDTKSYQNLATAKVAAGQKPWNLIGAMMQRKEQDYGKTLAMRDATETGIAGIHAINEPDSIALQKKTKEYNDAIKQAIDETGGSPGALLPYLTDINRRFRMDAMNGDLSKINQRYATGIEDLKQAKKDVSSGKLSQLGYRLQQKVLGTGIVVPRTGDIDSATKGILSKNFKGSLLNKNDAYATYMKSIIGKFGMIYNSLDNDGKLMFQQMATNSFKQYYRDSGLDNAISGLNARVQKPVAENVQDVNRDPFGYGNRVKFKDGKIIGIDDSEAMKLAKATTKSAISVINPAALSAINAISDNKTVDNIGDMAETAGKIVLGKAFNPIPGSELGNTANAVTEYVTKPNRVENLRASINKYSKNYGLDKSLTEEQKYNIIKHLRNREAEVGNSEYKLPENTSETKYNQFSLLTPDGKSTRDLTGSTVEIKTGNGKWEKVSGSPNKAVFSHFGDKPVDRIKQLKPQSQSGGLVALGSKSAPASIVYNMSDKDGNPIHFRITSNDTHISDAMEESWKVQNAISDGNVNQLIQSSGKNLITVRDKDGNTKRVPYSYFKVETILPHSNSKNPLTAKEIADNTRYVVVPYTSNKTPLLTYDKESGKMIEQAFTPKQIFNKGYMNVANYRKIK